SDESPCAPPASAVAGIDFAVSPTGTVNFGDVNLGSFADRTLSVSNTGGGTVSGTVSTSASFSIVSGSAFTLVGVGVSQEVTVRFTPTTSATATANVDFAASGGTISRIMTGSAMDATPPTVAITSPTFGASFNTSNALLTLGGTAADNVGVTQVTWANSRGGGGTATGTTSWAASGIGLQPGTNVLTVTAHDAVGNTTAASLTVTMFTFTDDPLTAQSMRITAAHCMELRSAIDSLRAAPGLTTFACSGPTLTPGSTMVKVVHLVDLRTALTQAYVSAGRTPPTYSDPFVVGGATIIKAIHLSELRTAVGALE